MKFVPFQCFDSPESALFPIKACVGVLEFQPVGELQFTILLVNQVDSDILVENPADFVTYTLVDANGWPRAIPAPKLRGKVHSPNILQTLTNRTPYVVHINTSIVQQDKELISQTPHPNLLIHPYTEIRQTLAVRGIRSSYNSDDVVEVSAGQYKIDFLLPLRWADKNGRHQYISLKSEALNVTLK